MDTLVNFVHLVFAVIWVGGMIYTHFVFMPSMEAVDPPQRPRLLGGAAKRFTIIAWLSTVVLLITGLVRTPGSMLMDTSTRYGSILTIKLFVFAAMIVIGFIITFRVAPQLRRHAPGPGQPPPAPFLAAQRSIKILSGVNMVLGAVVLLLVTLLRL